jgi:hypothetical protein
MPSPFDLITNARARAALPSAATTGSDDTAINNLITVCSKLIHRYCKRIFVQQSYDEVYNGNGQRQLVLRNFPLISVQSVRYRPVYVLKIQNTLANTPQARVEVLQNGLRLTRVTSGVVITDTSITWAANPTILAVQNAINALDSGWSAVGTGYDPWPSSDLYFPNGISGANDPGVACQGALTAANQFAQLIMHTYELAGYQINERQGWLLRAIPYTDPELLHPEDLLWPVGVNNFRVQYTAGYASIPEDIQEACAQLVAYHFRLGPRETPDVPIPPAIAQLLTTYRSHTIRIPGG